MDYMLIRLQVEHSRTKWRIKGRGAQQDKRSIAMDTIIHSSCIRFQLCHDETVA